MKIEDESKERLIEKIVDLNKKISQLEEKDSLRIHTEKALVRSKATAYAFINATSDLAILMDPQGIILEINEAVVRRVKKKVEELIGKSLFHFFPQEFKEFRKVLMKVPSSLASNL